MTIERKLLGTTPVSSGIEPEAVSFVATDYLSKSTLTGQANSKTFTFSAWIYVSSKVTGGNAQIYHVVTNDRFQIYHSRVNNAIYFAGGIVNEGNILTGHTGANSFPLDTWSHFLISVNMASTSQRHVYINDEIPSSLYWGTYNNFNIEFNVSGNNVGGDYSTAKPQRLSNVFLDYTYRNLSTTSNRRLFIDADGKPSDTIPSSPIVYLPMTDAATAGSNSGTGGDFTVNGVLATAERGPNQDNCSASTFDGSADYLKLTSPSGVSTSKQGTVSFVFSSTTSSLSGEAVYALGASVYAYYNADDKNLQVRFKDSASTGPAAVVFLNNFNGSATNHVAVSVDVNGANTANRHVYVNGAIYTDVTWDSWADVVIGYTSTPWTIGAEGYSPPSSNSYFEGYLGELYLNNTYIDLSTDNPFWDSDANRPNSVRKVIADTSVTPLIALPIMGNDAGNNLGSGGDFTVNSGPYTGARGGSEFWARSADFNGSTGYLSRAGLTGAGTTKTVSWAYAVRTNTSSAACPIFSLDGGSGAANGTQKLQLFSNSQTSDDSLVLRNNAGNDVGKVTYESTHTLGNLIMVVGCMDLSVGTSATHVYLNGVAATFNNHTAINEFVDFSTSSSSIGSRFLNSQLGAKNMAMLYLSSEYIDFSQEANRNKFIDQLGYPKDLGADGSEPTGSSPLIYMKFDDTAALGTNSGTGGNFTVNGTVTAGADVTP